MIKDKKILITGGGGFISTALAKRVVDYNEVTLLDRDFSGNSFACSEFVGKNKIQTKLVDILDKEKLMGELRGNNYDIIVHAAAMWGVQNVISNVSQTLDVNYNGISNLLKAISGKYNRSHVVILSTSEIFGSNAVNVSENSGSSLISVQSSRWCYSISKLASEYLAMEYYKSGLPVIIIRPFNIFGDGRTGDYVILRYILNALKNKDLEVYGNGNQVRSWCYIDDFCDAIIGCLEKDDIIGETFNIGNPLNTITIYRLAKLIVKMCDSKSRIVFRPLNFSDVNIRIPDISKARKVLGYSPKVELEEGLEKTIEWVKRNYGKVKSNFHG